MVLAMPSDMPTPKSDLPGLTPKLAAEYARAGPRTLTRDINRLVEAGLIVKRRGLPTSCRSDPGLLTPDGRS